ALLGNRDPQRALDSYRRALAIDQKLNEEDPSDAEYREGLAETYAHMARALAQSNQPRPAIELLEKAKGIWDPLLTAEPANAKRRAGLAWVYGGLGEAWTRLPGKRAEGCSWYQRSVMIWNGLETQGLLSASDGEAASRAAEGESRCRA